jgi:regulator of protease activity HflC (stomatin/prohibitin superfamily)
MLENTICDCISDFAGRLQHCFYPSDTMKPARSSSQADYPPPETNANFDLWRVIGLVAIFFGALLLIMLGFASYYTVGADSQGVVRRFGKFLKTVEPGLHFKLPFGIDTVTVVPTRRQLKLEFSFGTPGYLTKPIQVGQDPDAEKSMVTGDLNATLVEWVVQYRIEDPKQYLFEVRYPGETLRDLSEAAMREVIGDRTVDEVITIGRQDIEIAALARMQESARIAGQRERDLNEIQSSAYLRVQQIQGEADAKAAEIYARAYTQNPQAAEFCAFLKTLETYRKIFTKDSTLVLSTDSDIFTLLKHAATKTTGGISLESPAKPFPDQLAR